MNVTKILGLLTLAATLSLAAVVPAQAGDTLCPMGGVMVSVETDRDAALAWAKELRRVEVAGAETDAWSVLTLSPADEGIALLVEPGHVFFAVAGRGGEVYPRDIEKAFGKDLKKLREAVRRGMNDLWKARVAKITGGDVQPIADAVGLGVVAKAGGAWALATRDCQAVDLPASGL